MKGQVGKTPVTLNLDDDVIMQLDSIVAAHNHKRQRTSRSAIANSILAAQLVGDMGRSPEEEKK